MRRAASAWLVLPDGRVVLQRRDSKSKISSNLLATFGGGTEADETPEQTIRRELSEETDLKTNELKLEYMFDIEWIHPENQQKVIDSVFKIKIDSMDFKVFEGAGAEVYDFDELFERNDLSLGMKKLINKLRQI